MAMTKLHNRVSKMTAIAALAMLLAPVMAPTSVLADDKQQADSPATGATMQYHDPKTAPSDDDPLESINRVTSGFNSIIRGMILDPLIEGYKAVTPDGMQEAISNAASNLAEPVTAVSSMLQGDTENAGNATQRFLINSTVGIGGLSDPATDMGLESRQEDLGQAFGKNGMEPGPHIVLPIIGPSNMRDATGDILTTLANPLPLVGKAAQGTVGYADNKETIDAATKNSVDQYTTEKALYEQKRAVDINNGQIPVFADGPKLDLNDGPSVANSPSSAPTGN